MLLLQLQLLVGFGLIVVRIIDRVILRPPLHIVEPHHLPNDGHGGGTHLALDRR